MRKIVLAFGLLVSSAAFGNGLADMNQADRCAFWARNAMYGASQFMRGASREVQFISRATLLEMLIGPKGVGREKLYILFEDTDTDKELGFREQSTLYGYDAMSIWKAHNAERLPVRDEWRQHFLTACLESTAI